MLNFKTSSLAAVAAFTLAAAMPAAATTVTWKVQGTVEQAANLPPGIDVGDSFSMLLRFDPSRSAGNPTCGTGGPGSVCRYFGDPSQGFFGLQFEGFGPSLDITADQDNLDGNAIIVRNNVANPNGDDNLVDGYSFAIHAGDKQGKSNDFLLLFRGTNLGVVANASVLPTVPPAALTSLELSNFEICLADAGSDTCNNGLLSARVTQVTAVPEPQTWLMLGAGLLALGLRRRR